MSGKKSDDSLVSSAMLYTIGLFLVRGIAIISAPIFTRLLLPEEMAVSLLFNNWYIILSVLLTLYPQGSFAAAMRDFNKLEYKNYMSSSISLSTVSFGILSVVFLLIVQFFPSLLGLPLELVPIILLAAYFNNLYSALQIKLVYEGKQLLNVCITFIVTLFTMVLSVVLILYVLSDEHKAYARVFGYTIPLIFVGLVFIFKNFHFKSTYNKDYWIYCIKMSTPLIISTLSGSVLSQIDKLAVSFFVNNAAVGIYSINFSIAEIPNYLRLGFNQTWINWYFIKYSNKEFESINKMFKVLIRIASILFAGFILLVPEIATVLIDKRYLSGIIVIPPIVIGVFFNLLSNFYGTHVMYHKKNYYTMFSMLITLALSLVSNIILVPLFGILGSAFSSMISFVGMFVTYMILDKKSENPISINFSDIIVDILFLSIATIAFYMSRNVWYIRWSIGALLGSYLLYYFIKNKSNIDTIKQKDN